MKRSARAKKRILIVNDHLMMQQGRSPLVGQEPGPLARTEADTAAQALMRYAIGWAEVQNPP